MMALHLRRTTTCIKPESNSYHNKKLFSLKKILSNQTYNKIRVDNVNRFSFQKTLRLLSVVFILEILSISGSVFAEEAHSGTEENEAGYSHLISLLSGYLENDLQLQSLSLTAQSKSLSLQESKINNGIALSLSTGTMVLRPSSNGTTFTIEPSASLSLPQYNNTSLSLTGDVTLSSEENGSGMEDVSLSLSTDIISGNKLTRRVTLEKAQRELLEAERAVQKRALSAEQSFYTDLKSLLTQAQTVLTAEQTLYEDEVDFKTIVAQGYSKTSSTYRTADLKVRTATRELNEAKRAFIREQTLFEANCGVKKAQGNTSSTATVSSDETFETAWSSLPTYIPQVEGIDVLSFEESNYSSIESAKWDKYIGELTRQADKNISLSANAGYTFANSNTSSDTVDTGLSLTWSGVKASAGVSIPVASPDSTPAYSLGLTFTPSSIALTKISDEQKVLDSKLEDISISSAKDSYYTDVVTQQTSLSDLIWSRQSDKEEYETYSQLEKDTASWYKAGIVTESDYRSAVVNSEKARITCLVNDVEFIIYNNTTKLLFCDDENIDSVLKETNSSSGENK